PAHASRPNRLRPHPRVRRRADGVPDRHLAVGLVPPPVDRTAPPGIHVLPWLPISGLPDDARPARRIRGVGDPAIVTFAFAPDGPTIAPRQTDGRVALRGAAGGAGGHSFVNHRGFAQALAFSPDGRWLAVGGAEPDIVLYDLRSGAAGQPVGMPIREVN